MAEKTDAASEGVVDKAPRDEDFIGLARLLLRALGASRLRAALLGLSAGLFVVVGATAAMQIVLNVWTRTFYDSLAQKDIPEFGRQLVAYLFIAGALLALNVAQLWLNMTMKMKLREGLTRDLIAEWLTPRRAFLISGAGAIGVNPDQRIDADAGHLSDVSTDLGVGLLQSALLLVCFVGVLWSLSNGVVLSFLGRSFGIPGYMVWAALIYAGVASFFSWRVGRPLVPLNAERYARESDLRFALVHANEHSEGIAVHRGEGEEFDAAQPASRLASRHPAGDHRGHHPSDLGVGRLWLVHHRGADRRRLSRLFRRQSDFRGAADGGRRLQSGAAIPALVCR